MENSAVKAFYNDVMPEKFGDDYEHKRWFSDPIRRAGYVLTKDVIERHVTGDMSLNPARILELGPGAGTWTKLLVSRFPDAYIDLLDISKEMLERATRAVGNNGHLRAIESDILEWQPEGEYELFFSSRVLEYVNDKKKFCAKVFLALAKGGEGFLITKMPHYTRERALGRGSSELHRGQITPAHLRTLLREAGFVDVDLFPVTMSVPLLHSPKLNLALGKMLGPWKLGVLGMFFAESYCVVFRKPLHSS